MIIDAEELEDGGILRTDVCILGGGVVGLTLARELLGSGRDTLVVEQGGRSGDDGARSALRGRVVGYPYWGVEYVRHAQLGGTSHRWFLELAEGGNGGRFRPMDPIDFEARDEIPHSGWPLTRTQLEPYYERAQELMGLGPNEYDTSAWAPREETLLPDSDLLQTVIFQFGGQAAFVEEIPQRLEKEDTVRILTHSHVRSLEANGSGRAVSTAHVTTLGGHTLQIQANTFVLALGGIENARLLLLSTGRGSTGLGNEHDLVGRYFMEHPHFMSGVLWPSDPSLFDQHDLYFPHLRNETTIQGKLALREEVIRREQLRNFCVSLNPTSNPHDHVYRSPSWDAHRVFRSHLCKGYLPDRPLRDVWTMLSHGGPLLRHILSQKAAEVSRWMGRPPSPDVAYQLHYFSEQAPNPRSRVRLSTSQVDPFGRPTAELDLQFSADDISDVLRGQEFIKQEVERHGLGTLELEEYDQLPPPGIKGGFHHMGTTRMHRSPGRGVVNPDGRIHSVSNLYVAGSSVFPTGGYANPTLTICALTIRLADHLKSTKSEPITIGTAEPQTDRNPADT